MGRLRRRSRPGPGGCRRTLIPPRVDPAMVILAARRWQVRVVVTGGSGKGGSWVVRDLREHGHDVLNVDARHDGSTSGGCLVTELTDLGQTLDALAAPRRSSISRRSPPRGSGPRARPSGSMPSPPTTCSRPRSPTASGASCGRRARRCSGCRSTRRRPSRRSTRRSSRDPNRPTRCRSSSARRWPPSSPVGTRSGSSACASRTSWRRPTTPPSPSWQDDPQVRRWNLWGYVDARDVAQAVRLGLESDIVGSEIAIIAAADTTMLRPSAELMAEVFPNVPLRRPVEGRRDAPGDRSCATAPRL